VKIGCPVINMIESFVLNYAFVIGGVAIALGVLLILSVMYIAFLLKRSAAVFENTEFVVQYLKEYKEHIKNIATSDKFFKDPTIVSMMEYTKETVEMVEDYLGLFDYFESTDGNFVEGSEEEEDDG